MYNKHHYGASLWTAVVNIDFFYLLHHSEPKAGLSTFFALVLSSRGNALLRIQNIFQNYLQTGMLLTPVFSTQASIT